MATHPTDELVKEIHNKLSPIQKDGESHVLITSQRDSKGNILGSLYIAGTPEDISTSLVNAFSRDNKLFSEVLIAVKANLAFKGDFMGEIMLKAIIDKHSNFSVSPEGECMCDECKAQRDKKTKIKNKSKYQLKMENEEFDATEDTQGVSTDVKQHGLAIIVPKSVPDVLIINGVETSKAIIAAQKKDILAIKINGITDQANYELAEQKLKLIKKARTSSEKWRNDVSKPLRDFNSDLKKRIDGDAEEYKLMEDHLEAQIKPIKDYLEIERQKAEAAKNKLAEDRAEEIIQMGGQFDGKGTYNFPYEPSIFVLSASLRDLTEEEWEEQKNEILEFWNFEKKRIEDEKASEEAERQRVASESAKLNEKRTNLRQKELRLEGFESTTPNSYTYNGFIITKENILNLEDDDWDALVADALNPKEQTGDEGIKEVEFEENPIQEQPQSFAGISADIDDEEEREEQGFEVEHNDNGSQDDYSTGPAYTESNPKTRITLEFSEENPFIKVNFGPKFVQYFFPPEFEEVAKSDLEGGTVTFETDIAPGLQQIAVKRPE